MLSRICNRRVFQVESKIHYQHLKIGNPYRVGRGITLTQTRNLIQPSRNNTIVDELSRDLKTKLYLNEQLAKNRIKKVRLNKFSARMGDWMKRNGSIIVYVISLIFGAIVFLKSTPFLSAFVYTLHGLFGNGEFKIVHL